MLAPLNCCSKSFTWNLEFYLFPSLLIFSGRCSSINGVTQVTFSKINHEAIFPCSLAWRGSVSMETECNRHTPLGLGPASWGARPRIHWFWKGERAWDARGSRKRGVEKRFVTWAGMSAKAFNAGDGKTLTVVNSLLVSLREAGPQRNGRIRDAWYFR